MRYFFLIGTVLLFSCNKKDKSNYIVGDKIKFWDLYDPTEQHPRVGFSFSKKGECVHYIYQGTSCERKVVDDGDVVVKKTWDLINDSTLEFRSYNHRIIILNEDTLLTESKGSRILFLKSKCPDKEAVTK